MGAKFKEVNTLSFIGNIGRKTERVWKTTRRVLDSGSPSPDYDSGARNDV
jgi:hypothetical protein